MPEPRPAADSHAVDVDRRHHAAGFVHGGTVMKLCDEVARQDPSVEFVRLSRTNSTLAV